MSAPTRDFMTRAASLRCRLFRRPRHYFGVPLEDECGAPRDWESAARWAENGDHRSSSDVTAEEPKDAANCRQNMTKAIAFK